MHICGVFVVIILVDKKSGIFIIVSVIMAKFNLFSPIAILFLSSSIGYWHQRADEKHGNPPQGNQEPFVVKDKVGRPQMSSE